MSPSRKPKLNSKRRSPLPPSSATILKKIFEGKYGKEGGDLGADDFSKFCEDVYLPHAKDHLAPTTYSQVEGRIKSLKAFFRGKTLKEVTLIEIGKYRRARYAKNTRRGRPPCGATVKQDLNTLSAVLNHAIN